MWPRTVSQARIWRAVKSAFPKVFAFCILHFALIYLAVEPGSTKIGASRSAPNGVPVKASRLAIICKRPCWKNLKNKSARPTSIWLRRGWSCPTWGNVSGVDRASGNLVIKPSGVPYEAMTPELWWLFRWRRARSWRAISSPVPTRRRIGRFIRPFRRSAGWRHPHSLFATAWAQARTAIPCTRNHPCRLLEGGNSLHSPVDSGGNRSDYEANTGHVIIETFEHLDPAHYPACWSPATGRSPGGETRAMRWRTPWRWSSWPGWPAKPCASIPLCQPIQPAMREKHFFRQTRPGRLLRAEII